MKLICEMEKVQRISLWYSTVMSQVEFVVIVIVITQHDAIITILILSGHINNLCTCIGIVMQYINITLTYDIILAAVVQYSK